MATRGAGGSRGRDVPAILVALAPLAGVAIFSAYLYLRFGDALAWMHGAAAWGMPWLGRGPAPDPVRTAEDLRLKVSEVMVYTGDIAAFFLAAASIVPVTRRIGVAYGMWIAVNIFPPVAAHLFISLGRFTSVLFPLFFWLALVVPGLQSVRCAGVRGIASLPAGLLPEAPRGAQAREGERLRPAVRMDGLRPGARPGRPARPPGCRPDRARDGKPLDRAAVRGTDCRWLRVGARRARRQGQPGGDPRSGGAPRRRGRQAAAHGVPRVRVRRGGGRSPRGRTHRGRAGHAQRAPRIRAG